MKCASCGITVPELPEDAGFDETLCDSCYASLVEKPEETANPARIQRSRKKGSKLPEGCICVTRPGPYGNPYPIGSRHIFRDVDSGQEFEGTVVDVKGSLAFFRKYAMERLRGNPDWLKPLRGKTLACWCQVDTPCHGDILLELANAPEP